MSPQNPWNDFERQLWARLDAIDARLRAVEVRLGIVETKAVMFGAGAAIIVAVVVRILF